MMNLKSKIEKAKRLIFQFYIANFQICLEKVRKNASASRTEILNNLNML